MTRLPPSAVAEIRARAEAATPGPWRVGSVETSRVFIPWHVGLAGPGGERVLLDANPYFEHANDLAFIAAARSDIPALLADRAALVAEVERLSGLVEADDALASSVDAEHEAMNEVLAARRENDYPRFRRADAVHVEAVRHLHSAIAWWRKARGKEQP